MKQANRRSGVAAASVRDASLLFALFCFGPAWSLSVEHCGPSFGLNKPIGIPGLQRRVFGFRL